jgi:hypothetical protein
LGNLCGVRGSCGRGPSFGLRKGHPNRGTVRAAAVRGMGFESPVHSIGGVHSRVRL